MQAERSGRLTRDINGLDADADLFTHTAKPDRVVIHIMCCHRDRRMPHEARHGLDVHAAFDQRSGKRSPSRVAGGMVKAGGPIHAFEQHLHSVWAEAAAFARPEQR